MEIAEKKLKEILGKNSRIEREEYQRYLGALSEDFNSKVTLIAEQHGDIKK